jgi:hypothetical protein
MSAFLFLMQYKYTPTRIAMRATKIITKAAIIPPDKPFLDSLNLKKFFVVYSLFISAVFGTELGIELELELFRGF